MDDNMAKIISKLDETVRKAMELISESSFQLGNLIGGGEED